IFRFCRSKCNKLFKKKKNPRKTAWTKASRKARGKELSGDPVQSFEVRRDVPVKYTRELWEKTVEAVKEVSEIRSKRQDLHIKNTLKKGKEVKRLQEKNRVKKHIHLIKSPAAGLRAKNEAEMSTRMATRQSDRVAMMEEN
uniref:Probable ribosome biogenesis protein RLP24 n=2 Tax=Plectus sambesii TaxID=2011161 RepID=A0A914VI96_9BILA